MDESELNELRAQRMAQMQQQQQQKQPGGAQSQKQVAEQAQQQEEQKNAILAQVLDQNARARLSNISVANPERARQLENMIVQMARYGQIRGKLDEDTLKSLLAQVAEKTKTQTTTVKFDRRRAALDSDDD